MSNLEDEDLFFIYISLYYWGKELQHTIFKGGFSEEAMEKNKETMGKLNKLIDKIQMERTRRKIYESH